MQNKCYPEDTKRISFFLIKSKQKVTQFRILWAFVLYQTTIANLGLRNGWNDNSDILSFPLWFTT
jgi:hypothetical protein